MTDKGSTALRWHYTIGPHYAKIIESGVIRPATANVLKGERPAVWFSLNPAWEQTACKGIIEDGVRRSLPFEEMLELRIDAFRFGVIPSLAPYDWSAYVRKSRVNPRMAKGLLTVATEMGADPQEWFVSFAPVPVAQCSAIDIWYENDWHSVL